MSYARFGEGEIPTLINSKLVREGALKNDSHVTPGVTMLGRSLSRVKAKKPEIVDAGGHRANAKDIPLPGKPLEIAAKALVDQRDATSFPVNCILHAFIHPTVIRPPDTRRFGQVLQKPPSSGVEHVRDPPAFSGERSMKISGQPFSWRQPSGGVIQHERRIRVVVKGHDRPNYHFDCGTTLLRAGRISTRCH